MKCPNCDIEMVKGYRWMEHPGPAGRMIGHPGALLRYECKQCGAKVDAERGRKELKIGNIESAHDGFL